MKDARLSHITDTTKYQAARRHIRGWKWKSPARLSGPTLQRSWKTDRNALSFCSIRCRTFVRETVESVFFEQSLPGTMPDMPEGAGYDLGYHNPLVLVFSAFPAALDEMRGLRPSREGTDKMIGAPSAHWLSCAGARSTGRLKRGKDPIFFSLQLKVLCHPVCSLPL